MHGKASKRALAVSLGAVALMAGATASASRPPHLVQSSESVAAGSWVDLAPATNPSARVASALGFDQKTSQMVLFGGIGTTGPSSGTWAWDGTGWSQLAPATSPSSRSGTAMAYDPASGQLLLFGGFAVQAGGPGFFSGTWAWDGTDWSLLHPAKSPPPLAGASMAYDPGTRQVVLFGGSGPTGASSATWAWDGTSWSQLSPATSPPALSGASMAYDPASGQVILFGGASLVDGKQDLFAGTWAWDGTGWSQLAPATSPPALASAAMAYDPATNELVLFGGGGAHGDFSATWAYKAPLSPATTSTQPQATTASTTTTSAPTVPTSTVPTTSQPARGAPGPAPSSTTTTPGAAPTKATSPPLPQLLVVSRNATGDGTVYLGVPVKVLDLIMAQRHWEGKAVLLARGQSVVAVVVGAKRHR